MEVSDPNREPRMRTFIIEQVSIFKQKEWFQERSFNPYRSEANQRFIFNSKIAFK